MLDLEAVLAVGAEGLAGDAHDFQVAADRLLSLGDEPGALAALDRAYGLAPDNVEIAAMRAALLDRFAVEEHGLVFRFVPAGTFLMGSTTGDPDERPVHPVRLDAFWIAELPMIWTQYCELCSELEGDEQLRSFRHFNKIRNQYSRDGKPMTAVAWPEAEALARRLSSEQVEYALPSEAEWEKAARGGLIGKRYPWGDEPPTPARCDFDHFGDFRIADPREFPPNGYGIYGMCGGVWEWTSTIYDALAYSGAVMPDFDPALLADEHREPPPEDQPQQRVLRGGSWADAAAAVTVSFRAARRHGWGGSSNPNVGFRLVRRARRSPR